MSFLFMVYARKKLINHRIVSSLQYRNYKNFTKSDFERLSQKPKRKANSDWRDMMNEYLIKSSSERTE